ncbi:hypothetical protein IFM89_036871 [Coptis chinensis]|uniref:Uncharacterized protein n=1 Tax=Coptis chinensis TaxID=261450 RepID=A0A835LY66_9MAGN|nr:hypothetical protein IFM89_036871 [Coptis chinensis]
MYWMDRVKVNTPVSGEIGYADFKDKLQMNKEKPTIINVNIGIGAMLNELSKTGCFEWPQGEGVCRPVEISLPGNIAHVVVMPNITIDKLDDFLNELIEKHATWFHDGKPGLLLLQQRR